MDAPDDPARMRIADADRHRVAEVLRTAAGDGRLDVDELEERLESAYAAKVYADLVPLVVDLPGGLAAAGGNLPAARPGPAVPHHAGPAPAYRSSVAVMSHQHRRGVWEPGGEHTAFSLMGEVEIDLREAVLDGPETVVTANAVMGSVVVVVNARTRVGVDGVGVMGVFEQSRDKVDPVLEPGSPTVRVKGVALMGSVTVVRRPMPGEKGRRPRLLGG